MRLVCCFETVQECMFVLFPVSGGVNSGIVFYGSLSFQVGMVLRSVVDLVQNSYQIFKSFVIDK